ncbi:hypothetical protein EZV62_018513 [Acer yangbiense]|uniref:Reverse transcriptase Ty1/copia-type domain-containing protein n=1 Tax=Acer yangbiense TaxID=1000413 RepID=A0A5C7HJJ9_9ROSI|nr:hypothetical protein EZV62_018513 [Acer yangbiense]
MLIMPSLDLNSSKLTLGRALVRMSAVWEELRALQKNETWEISELPKGKKLVGCKWIFTVKHKADGTVERFKVRLVAKGFIQSYGIDYMEIPPGLEDEFNHSKPLREFQMCEALEFHKDSMTCCETEFQICEALEFHKDSMNYDYDDQI